jgi:[citrate (pro-3S)-lyase] ligase
MWLFGFDLQLAQDEKAVANFLASYNLDYDVESDLTVVVKQGEEIVATGSLRENILQCFAVKPELRGVGLSAKIVDYLVQAAYDRGYTRLFVFTRPTNVDLFKSLGFRLLAETSLAALLEIGTPSIQDYTRDLAGHAVSVGGSVGGMVMNCNPFTLGHQYLVEQAAVSCRHVYLFVVQEERSAFPFSARFEMVKRGTAHLPNVTVLPSGPYTVSLATFPSYFTAEETTHARAGAGIDATVYGKHIAPALRIDRRFVGTEPYSPVTRIYNRTMEEVLRKYGVELIEIPRLEIDGRPVSASEVREGLRADDYERWSVLVPETTKEFLLSPEAAPVIERLKKSRGRH